MRRYSYQKDKKSRKEKIGFFTALAVCISALGLALYSTYAGVGGFDNANVTEPTYVATLEGGTDAVDNNVTGVTVTETTVVTSAPVTIATEEQTGAENTTDPYESYTGDNNSLQTMLQVADCLSYPVTSRTVLREYSEEAVYSETMKDYRAHTGVDFKADIGENIMSMSDGEVEDIYTDDMFGKVIRIRNGNFSILYCGISGKIYCAEGEQITQGDVIGQVGEVPCESADDMHLHVEVWVGNNHIDPLTVISNNE